MPRIILRCGVNGVPADFSRLLMRETRVVSTTSESNQHGARETMLVDTPGRVLVDVMVQLMKHATIKLRDYSLKKAAEVIFKSKKIQGALKKGDVKHAEIWPLFFGTQAERTRLAEYCAMDVDVTWQLEEALKCVDEVVGNGAKRFLTGREYVTRAQSFCYKRLLAAYSAGYLLHARPWGEKGCPLYQLMPRLMELITRGNYEGGLVQDPVIGLHKHLVVTLDFSSLYPSIMRLFNLSPDVFVGDRERVLALGLNPDDLQETPNGFFFHKASVRKGLLVSMLEQLIAQRSAIKKQMEACRPGSPEYGVLDAYQAALKIAANSIYGLMGTSTNPAGNMAIAETVCAYGRRMITAVKEYLQLTYPRYTIIYGDTDSLMVRLDTLEGTGPEAVDAARAIGHEMARRINVESGIVRAPMKMAFEKVILPLIQAPKRYVFIKYSPNAGDLESTFEAQGNEVKRRDNPAFLPDALTGLLDLILYKNAPKEELIAYTQGVMARIMQGKLTTDELVMSQGISKKLDQYDGTQAHVKVARQLKAAGYSVEAGDRVNFIFIEGQGKKASQKAWPLELFDPAIHRADASFYLQKAKQPFKDVLEHVLTTLELQTLFDPEKYKNRTIMGYFPGLQAPKRPAAETTAAQDRIAAGSKKRKLALPATKSIAETLRP